MIACSVEPETIPRFRDPVDVCFDEVGCFGVVADIVYLMERELDEINNLTPSEYSLRDSFRPDE